MDSLKIDKKPGNSKSSILRSFLPESFGANLSVNQTPNICWWPIAKPPPWVSSWVGSTVRLEATAQYTPRTIPKTTTNCNWLTSLPKAKAKSQVAVADCWTMMWPVMKTVRTLVIRRKMTKAKLAKKATKSTCTVKPVAWPASFKAASAAACPK